MYIILFKMDENEFRKDEAFINQNSQHIQTKDIPKIQKCICKFHQYDQKDEKQIIGTGFFLKFPFGKKGHESSIDKLSCFRH